MSAPNSTIFVTRTAGQADMHFFSSDGMPALFVSMPGRDLASADTIVKACIEHLWLDDGGVPVSADRAPERDEGQAAAWVLSPFRSPGS